MDNKELLYKIAHNRASEADVELLRSRLQQMPPDELGGLMDAYAEVLQEVHEFGEVDQRQLQAMLGRIHDWNRKELSAPVRSVFMVRWLVAASVILLAGIGLYAWFGMNNKAAHPSHIAAQIKPGREGALLTLSDGRQVLLDTVSNGGWLVQSGAKLTLEDGQVKYAEDDSASNPSGEIAYNILSTPRGRQYQLELPDGSRVWLNAESSIRFPTRFTGKERRVEVTGEAYFEVANDSRIAFVATVNNKVEVQVLGTAFNINGYDDEPCIRTTLVEGSVAVKPTKGNATLLEPGQQARVDEADQISVSDVNVEEVVSWKNNRFIFHNTDIKSLMRQVARWYDIDVEFEGDIPELFVAEVSRKEPLSELLSLLELTKSIHFRIEGRKVVVIEGEK